MKWMRFRVRTNADSEDIIVSAMADIGLYGAQIEDKVPLSGRELEELFIDEAPVPVIADDRGEADLACLNFYVEIPDPSDPAAEGDPGQDPAADGTLRLLVDSDTVTPEEMKARMQEVLDGLRQFSDIGDGTISISVTEDIDWRDNWKQYFHKFFLEDTLVLPSWESMSAEEERRAGHVLHIDPGAAFGTGLHETTQLAVRALKRTIEAAAGEKDPGQHGDLPTLLDIGTGSGVLAILALMYGAGYTVGVDLDPLAVTAAEENRDRNGYSEREMQVYKGDVIGDEAFRGKLLRQCAAGRGMDTQTADPAGNRYDIVIANILPVVLVPLTPVIPELLKEDGTLIYSGILTDRVPEVTEALERTGFRVTGIEELGEWSGLTAVRKEFVTDL